MTSRWLPLESNPEVMNKYVRALGMPSTFEFVDVWGLDFELLLMVPRPVTAVMLLYPLTDKCESQPLGSEAPGDGVYFMKQTIGNACGTIALIHALCNNKEKLGFDPSKHLSKFLGDTEAMSPEERGKHLEEDSAFGVAHEESAQEGQTKAPSRDDKVDLHFIAFVEKDGGLYELDGRKNAPIRHGDTTADNLLEDAAKVVKKFMARDPDNVNFTVVALAKAG
ncbi:hypothetical protein CAPTEDRAFT_181658 [Capitella teleta]|uniref:Ubiquitin carboxyl-terminal hydrolase n=1 Tax=Capitella teleta TaxID=283909 RepID=R7TIR0_CAPTE|nr:hypothetical protein CAPTEDRAFT_181658 [Capitella teleta]|eukprot:ELT93347.1 hypothetical protein CAPTEDRAFT_181658 [Capitella teleta]